MKLLQLGEGFEIPHEAITETFGLLAVRGAGKTNAARVMAEEMFAAGLPFVAVDPVGSWWGLRSARDGKGPGLAVPIFGGKHGDVPLEHWRGRLPPGERACLEVLVSDYPRAVPREVISEVTGYRRSSRDTYLQRLRSRRLVVEADRGTLRAADELFG